MMRKKGQYSFHCSMSNNLDRTVKPTNDFGSIGEDNETYNRGEGSHWRIT